MYKANFKKEEHKHKHTIRTNHQLKGVPTAAQTLRAFCLRRFYYFIKNLVASIANSDSTANVPKEVTASGT